MAGGKSWEAAPENEAAGDGYSRAVGQDEFLTGLFREYRDALRRFFAARLGGNTLPDDAVQQVFLQAVRENSRRRIEKPRAFLFVIASNLVKDERRKRRTRFMDRHEPIGDDVVCPRPPPDLAAESRQELSLLIKALMELKPKYRCAFLLHRFHGLTYDEIAEEMGISASSVRNYISLALVHSRARLGRKV